jgi:hypothetical protein
MRRNERRSFFHGAIDIRGDVEAVPVDDFGVGGVVLDVDGHAAAFFHAEEGAGGGVVVGNSFYYGFGGDFEGRVIDDELVVGGLRVEGGDR